MVMTGAELVGLMSAILGMAGQLNFLVDGAQLNMEKCKLLQSRVGTITLLVQELKSHMKPEEWTKDLLEDLNDALSEGMDLLNSCHALSQGMDLVNSCQEKRGWSRVYKTQKKANKFDALDQRISRILNQFHIINMILIVRINNGRFFENVLQKLLDNGACMQLPQNVKEDLKSSINRLTNTDNMSSDAQKLLEWIIRDITYRGQLATIGSSGAQRRTEASSTGDYLVAGILDVTERIMRQARPDNGGEIQRIVNLVQDLWAVWF